MHSERKNDRELNRRLEEVSQLPRMKDVKVYLDNGYDACIFLKTAGRTTCVLSFPPGHYESLTHSSKLMGNYK